MARCAGELVGDGRRKAVLQGMHKHPLKRCQPNSPTRLVDDGGVL